MLALTLLTRTQPFRSPSGHNGSCSGADTRHAAIHSSVLAGERYGRGVLRPIGGRSSLAIVLRAAGDELLEVSTLRLDEEGFGSLRLELRRADVSAIATELCDLVARGADVSCVATDGSAAADAVAGQLTGRVSLRTGTRALRRHARSRLGLESLPGEGRAYREVLAERFLDGTDDRAAWDFDAYRERFRGVTTTPDAGPADAQG